MLAAGGGTQLVGDGATSPRPLVQTLSPAGSPPACWLWSRRKGLCGYLASGPISLPDATTAGSGGKEAQPTCFPTSTWQDKQRARDPGLSVRTVDKCRRRPQGQGLPCTQQSWGSDLRSDPGRERGAPQTSPGQKQAVGVSEERLHHKADSPGRSPKGKSLPLLRREEVTAWVWNPGCLMHTSLTEADGAGCRLCPAGGTAQHWAGQGWVWLFKKM